MENGFFCLFPDDATAKLLENYCSKPHISILVIENKRNCKDDGI